MILPPEVMIFAPVIVTPEAPANTDTVDTFGRGGVEIGAMYSVSGGKSSIVEVDDIVSLRANTFAIEGKVSSGDDGVVLLLLYTEGGGGIGITVDSGGMGVFDFGSDMGVTGCGGEVRVSEFGVEMGVTECDEVEATECGGEMGVVDDRGNLAISAWMRSRGAWG